MTSLCRFLVPRSPIGCPATERLTSGLSTAPPWWSPCQPSARKSSLKNSPSRSDSQKSCCKDWCIPYRPTLSSFCLFFNVKLFTRKIDQDRHSISTSIRVAVKLLDLQPDATGAGLCISYLELLVTDSAPPIRPDWFIPVSSLPLSLTLHCGDGIEQR